MQNAQPRHFVMLIFVTNGTTLYKDKNFKEQDNCEHHTHTYRNVNRKSFRVKHVYTSLRPQGYSTKRPGAHFDILELRQRSIHILNCCILWSCPHPPTLLLVLVGNRVHDVFIFTLFLFIFFVFCQSL